MGKAFRRASRVVPHALIPHGVMWIRTGVDSPTASLNQETQGLYNKRWQASCPAALQEEVSHHLEQKRAETLLSLMLPKHLSSICYSPALEQSLSVPLLRSPGSFGVRNPGPSCLPATQNVRPVLFFCFHLGVLSFQTCLSVVLSNEEIRMSWASLCWEKKVSVFFLLIYLKFEDIVLILDWLS